jgi:nucleoid DNA-binding protein
MAKKKSSRAAGGPLNKSGLIQAVIDGQAGELSKKDVRGLLEQLATVGYKELKANSVFTVPGLVRMVVKKKPATKARKGVNPFTGEPAVFKAKPARKVIRARPVKAAKDAI